MFILRHLISSHIFQIIGCENFHHQSRFTMDQYFIYNTHYKVLICREHGYAIKPSFIERHLQETHPSISFNIRHELLEQVKQLVLHDPSTVEAPQDTPAAIRGLNITDSLECIECHYVRKHIRDITDHCTKVHDWKKSSPNMWKSVKVQTFFTGKNKK